MQLGCLLLMAHGFAHSALAQTSPSAGAKAASRDGAFQFDVPGVVGRSDVVLGKPNLEAAQAMPLGNGSLGVAVWSANGFTAQLNRNDTLPDRLSSGQVVIPGLTALAGAKDYAGRLDLYDGEFHEHGGGMTATAFVDPDKDGLVVDVKGANPNQTQTALLKLWAPRAAHSEVAGMMGTLAQTWVDDSRPESSGRTFGMLTAISAMGRDVTVAVTDPLTITVTFRPFPDGHFRVLAAAPHYDGTQDIRTTAANELLLQPNDLHQTRWHAFWNHAALIKISSKDGAGEYMENLRNLYLFVAAIEKGVEYPGTQAGIADMISSAEDVHRWDPSAFWHWNLRMMVAANLGAGLPELNTPYFNLYLENLSAIEAWTKKHMSGLPGSCVPETMRFNGRGIEYESQWTPIAIGLNCATDFKPYYNARTLSTGAEVSLWAWQQYLMTNDRDFLAELYPLMASSARFLLAYQKQGSDGLLHTGPSNSHETQWDVTDPTTDLSAIMALYPATIEAAGALGKDADLVEQLRAALKKIPSLPRTGVTGSRMLLPASADVDGNDVIAESWQPRTEEHNVENIGLEPVWPYGLIGDDSPLTELARRTYTHRPFTSGVDWSLDGIQAARLGLGNEVSKTLMETTEKFQRFVNGMAQFDPTSAEFYVEQTGVVADALQEALVQDYDGLIRVAPAVPQGWDFDGSVAVRGKSRVYVETRNGAVVKAGIASGTAQQLRMRNPWMGRAVDVVDARTKQKVKARVEGTSIEFRASAGVDYLIEPAGQAAEGSPFLSVTGKLAVAARRLGPVQIGIFADGQ